MNEKWDFLCKDEDVFIFYLNSLSRYNGCEKCIAVIVFQISFNKPSSMLADNRFV